MKNGIKIPKKWLEQLYELSEQSQKDLEKCYLADKTIPPSSFSMLIGFASSAKDILKY